MGLKIKLSRKVRKRLLTYVITGVVIPFLASLGIPDEVLKYLTELAITYIVGQSVSDAAFAFSRKAGLSVASDVDVPVGTPIKKRLMVYAVTGVLLPFLASMGVPFEVLEFLRTLAVGYILGQSISDAAFAYNGLKREAGETAEYVADHSEAA